MERPSLPEPGGSPVTVGYHVSMRRFAVILTVVGVILVALAAGWVAADLPYWCRRLGVCTQPSASDQKLQRNPAEIRL
jgi:hypothetical protein